MDLSKARVPDNSPRNLELLALFYALPDPRVHALLFQLIRGSDSLADPMY